MAPRTPRTISYHLGLLVLMVAVPLLVLTVALLLWSAALARHAVDRGLREAARLLAVAVEKEIATSSAALYALAATPITDCTPTTDLYSRARTVAVRHGGWVVMIDAQGQQRMNTLRPLGAALPRRPDTELAQAARSGPYVSDMLMGSLIGGPVVFVAVPVAARTGACWLGMAFGPERFGELVSLPREASAWSTALTDRHYTIIAPWADDSARLGRAPEWYAAATRNRDRGVVNGEWGDEGPVRLAYQRLGDAGWVVAVKARQADFLAAWAWPAAVGGFVSLLVVCAAILFAGAYARRMKLEVDRLVRHARSLGQGSLPAPPVRATVAELETLDRVLVRADEDIRERQAEHEKRVASEVSRAAAENVSRSKDLFLAMLSHELRGPLTAVIGWLDVARQAPEDRDIVARALDTALRNAKQQARIIEDLLEMSRIVSDKFSVDRRPMDLASLALEAVDDCRLAAAENGVELRCSLERPAPIRGDRQRLHQALGNLIGNAIKFNRPGGWVALSLERDRERVRVTIADNGAGIAAEALPHVFERFWQAEARSRMRGGLGLGLPLVRHIVELHEGRVWTDSAGLGKGARFFIELPAMREERALAGLAKERSPLG